MSSSDHRRATADRRLGLRTRRDLEVVAVPYSGLPTYVVRDPVTGDSFHFTALERRLLAALEEPTSLAGLQRVLEREFAPARATTIELQHFVNRLYAQGLLISVAPGQGAELKQRSDEAQRRRRLARWTQILSIRLGGVPAGPVIDRLSCVAGWAWSRPAALAALGLALYAAAMLVARADEAAARLPALTELAQPRWLVMWIAAVAGVKALHELGHATACRRYGVAPREIGVLLLAGAPALYCDVSDLWRLPSKWQRMAVAGAGMYVELVIAALAALVWLHAAPGPLAALCLSLLVVCSVGTLLVNLNPLLRYDGYYILSDWMETPNLAERSRGLLAAAWRRWLLGQPPEADPLLGPHKRRALWVYAVLSKAYLAVVLVGLVVVLVRAARPYHLENLAYAAAVLVAAGMLFRPLASAGRAVRNPAWTARLRRGRLAATAGGVLLAAGLLLAAPITRRVAAPAVVAPAATHPLFAVTAGMLDHAVASGTLVERGQTVVRLRNPELELALVRQEGEVRERRAEVERLRVLQAQLPQAARRLPTAAAELAAAEAQLAEERRLADLLVIRAPARGRVWAPPPRPAPAADLGALRPWSGSPLDRQNRGAWIEPGTPLAIVAEPGGRIAWVGVDQRDVAAVEPGQTARVAPDEAPLAILTGRVTRVSRQARDNSPADAARTASQKQLWGERRYHVVEIALDDAAVPLLPGAHATVRIATYRSTVAAAAWRAVRQAFDRAL